MFHPDLNDLAAEGIVGFTASWNHVRLVYPQGEVDFIAALPLTTHPTTVAERHGRHIALETPAEIAGKKSITVHTP